MASKAERSAALGDWLTLGLILLLMLGDLRLQKRTKELEREVAFLALVIAENVLTEPRPRPKDQLTTFRNNHLPFVNDFCHPPTRWQVNHSATPITSKT
jgi:hypothetical protein